MSKIIETNDVSDRADYFVQYLIQVGEAINNLNDKVEELQKADDGLTESGVERMVNDAMDNFDFSDVIYNENLATESYVDDAQGELTDRIENMDGNLEDVGDAVKANLFDLLLEMAKSVDPHLWEIREGKRKVVVGKSEEVSA